MSVWELLRLALSRLRTSRMRAALTMLGVIIGVASVVALVGIGQGTTSNITDQLNNLGTNLLTISPATQNSDGSTSLAIEDADAIAALALVADVAPEVSTNLTVTAGEESTSTSIVGTTAAYASVRAYDMWQGSFLTEVAVAQSLRVAVLGATALTLVTSVRRSPSVASRSRSSASCRPRAGPDSRIQMIRSWCRSGPCRSTSLAVTAFGRSVSAWLTGRT